jgi:hypothetical protein
MVVILHPPSKLEDHPMLDISTVYAAVLVVEVFFFNICVLRMHVAVVLRDPINSK